MIQTWNQTLKNLAADPEDLFHTHVRQRIGKKATDHFERKLKEFILEMPAIISRIDEISSAEPEGSAAHRLTKYLLIYIHDPVDFLPETDNGLFGYLDDAYFVAIVYLMIVGRLGVSAENPEDRKIKEGLFKFLEYVRYVIPAESRKIEKTVSDIVTNQILCYSGSAVLFDSSRSHETVRRR